MGIIWKNCLLLQIIRLLTKGQMSLSESCDATDTENICSRYKLTWEFKRFHGLLAYHSHSIERYESALFKKDIVQLKKQMRRTNHFSHPCWVNAFLGKQREGGFHIGGLDKKGHATRLAFNVTRDGDVV